MNPTFPLTAEVKAFNGKINRGPLTTVAIRPRRRRYIFPRHSKTTIGIASKIHARNINRKGQSPTRTSWTIDPIIAIQQSSWIGALKYHRSEDIRTSYRPCGRAVKIPLGCFDAAHWWPQFW